MSTTENVTIPNQTVLVDPPPAVFQTGKVLVLSIGHFSHDVFTAFLSPLLPLIIQKLGISLTLAGTLASLQQLPSLIDPFLGLLADRGKLRWLIILAPTISAAGMSLAGLTGDYSILALLLVSVGFSTAIWHTAAPVMVKRVAGRQATRGLSYFMIGGSLAFSVSPLVAVAAVSWWGLEGIWRLFPLALFATVLLYWQTRNLEGFQSTSKNSKGTWAESWRVLKPVMLLIAGIIITQSFIQVALTTYLPIFLTSQGSTLWLAGGALSIYEIAGAVGTYYIGTISDRLNRRLILATAGFIAPVLTILFLFSQGWLRMGILLLIGFAALSTSPVLMAMVQEYSRDHPATANGLYFTSIFASRSLIIILVGSLADKFGLQPTFFGCALAGFLALPLIWRLPETGGKS
jgi:FSR family fosmidomycin resistance protein-like MFS transporter